LENREGSFMSESVTESLDMREEENQVKLFKALANPVRLAIVRYLYDGPSCVNLGSIKLGISQPNLSKHLCVLQEAGLVGYKEHGVLHCYFLCRPSLVKSLLAILERSYGFVPCSKIARDKKAAESVTKEGTV